MKNAILFASICVASGVLFVNIYTSLVDAKAWGNNVPESIATARDYFKTSNPGNFFRIFSPLNQILAILALILFWKASPAVRAYLGIALVMYLIAEALTFAYFYPRNDIMFKTAQLSDTELLKKTVAEWSMMNWIRTLIVLAGLCFSSITLHKIYSLRTAV